MSSKRTQTLKIDERDVSVSSLDKVLFPANGFTKGQMIDFYIRISPYLLPHLKRRPITLKRFPTGASGPAFYEKNAPRFTPKWVDRFPVPRRAGGAEICYVVMDNLATLVWACNLYNIELHPFLHRVPKLDRPTAVVFDLDPGPGAELLTCIEVALLIKSLLDSLRLQCFAKVSGSKGLQLYVPLNAAVTYDATQRFAHGVAQHLARDHPTLIVAEMAKNKRRNRVFIDWSQNSDFKTTVGVYSLRAKREQPFVSMPVRWNELEQALRVRNQDSLYFSPSIALARVEKEGDLFEPVLHLKQRLPKSALQLK